MLHKRNTFLIYEQKMGYLTQHHLQFELLRKRIINNESPYSPNSPNYYYNQKQIDVPKSTKKLEQSTIATNHVYKLKSKSKEIKVPELIMQTKKSTDYLTIEDATQFKDVYSRWVCQVQAFITPLHASF